MKERTHLIHSIPVDPHTGAVSVPIYQTSTFVQQAPGIHKGFDYSRSNNPTRQALEKLIAALECGHSGYAFASGLAAVDAVLKLLESGDEVLAVDDIYGGTFRMFAHIYEKFGIRVKYVDTSDLSQVVDHISSKTRLVWLETPTNPTLKISYIREISKIAHQHDALLVVDNTFASPAIQQPLLQGADIVLHSATKYLAGHSDVVAGLVVAKDAETAARIKFVQNATGAILGPQDSWLTIRGIETLHLRVKQQSENALAVATFLQQCPEVDRVYYPGLPTHKDHELAKQQQRYFGGIVSFSLKDDTENAALSFISSTRLFQLAESLGGVKSLLCHPPSMTHKGTPRAIRHKTGIQDSLIRLSCGIENAEDLVQDIRWALLQIRDKAAFVSLK
ncbi:MAG: PLP-dependent transferase [Bacteroidetes bacterium]|nr:MAG: PLP-dependent transferase [Bacteroidota bacterium]